MAECVNCRKEVADDAEVCPHCGQNLDEPIVQQKPHCGTPHP
jgi:rRNA maturation endonuclease Nob1